MADGIRTGVVVGDFVEKTPNKDCVTVDRCQKRGTMDKESVQSVNEFCLVSNSVKLYDKLCSDNASKHDEELMPSEEDCRRKRCVDRYDSSESSDSGVAVLSCTDCSGSSTASSDITDPGSPFSTASNHSEDSSLSQQSTKMPPTQNTHHSPWLWTTVDDRPPITIPGQNSDEEVASRQGSDVVVVAAEPSIGQTQNHRRPSTSSIEGAKVVKTPSRANAADSKTTTSKKLSNKKYQQQDMSQKMHQGKITEYFKTHVKASNGFKKTVNIKHLKNINNNNSINRTVSLVDQQTQFNSFKVQSVRKVMKNNNSNNSLTNSNHNNNRSNNGKTMQANKTKKTFAPVTPRKILPAPAKSETITIRNNVNNIINFPLAALSTVNFTPNLTYLHTKVPKPPDANCGGVFAPRFASIADKINAISGAIPIINNRTPTCLNVIHHQPIHHHHTKIAAAINNFNCVKLNATVVPIVKLNNPNNNNNNGMPLKSNGSNRNEMGLLQQQQQQPEIAATTLLTPKQHQQQQQLKLADCHQPMVICQTQQPIVNQCLTAQQSSTAILNDSTPTMLRQVVSDNSISKSTADSCRQVDNDRLCQLDNNLIVVSVSGSNSKDAIIVDNEASCSLVEDGGCDVDDDDDVEMTMTDQSRESCDYRQSLAQSSVSCSSDNGNEDSSSNSSNNDSNKIGSSNDATVTSVDCRERTCVNIDINSSDDMCNEDGSGNSSSEVCCSSGVVNDNRSSVEKSLGGTPAQSDCDSGVSSSSSFNGINGKLEISVDFGQEMAVLAAATAQKSPILSKPKTIRFPFKQHKMERDDGGISADSIGCRWADCNAYFDTNGALLEHLQHKHVISQTARDEFTCYWSGCKVHGRTSCSRSWLERHVLAHAGSKLFRCIVDGCRQRFNSQLTLQRHVNNHFSTDGKPIDPAKKTPETTSTKLFKRNGKKIRFRRQPWSARMFDFIDSGIMEGLQHKLMDVTQKRTLGNSGVTGEEISLQSQVLARRIECDGVAKVLIRWHPRDIVSDEWVNEKDFRPVKMVQIPSLNASAKDALKPTLCLGPVRTRKHRRKATKAGHT